MNNIPVILLISERSGSNLLRTLIGKHKDICAPVSPHLMAEFYNYRKYYGDLRECKNAEVLLQDMLMVANHPFHDWKLNIDIVKAATEVNSVVGAVDYLYTKKTQLMSKIHYCSKGVDAFNFIDAFRSELPNVKFVHLVRDPRDHVASWMKKPINLLTPYDAILKWKSEQSTFIDAVTTRGLQSISIRYEDLISDTPSVMTRVLEFIGVDVDVTCFETDSENEESTRNPLWENLSKPIMKGNKEKFKSELSEEDILIIESLTKNEMSFFNYAPVSACNWLPPKDYEDTLINLRERKEKFSVIKSNGTLTDLTDKWEKINRIRNLRIEEWSKLNPSFKFDSKKNSKKEKDTIKTRIKYFSYSVMGKSLTSKLAKKIK